MGVSPPAGWGFSSWSSPAPRSRMEACCMAGARDAAAGAGRSAEREMSRVMTPLRVLILEDSEADAALLVSTLRDGGYAPAWERVETAAALAAAVDRQPWDVILAANVMARLAVRDALAVVRGRELDLPAIVLSRQRGETPAIEAIEAVESMRAGAHDYLLMQDLSRLVPAIERELREAAGRAAGHRAESALRRLVRAIETVGIGITVT